MSITPYVDLSTESILSAHISGLAHSINKLETALDMKTSTATITLNPVVDQDDLTLRYRIYEGSIRNWTSFTIKRNGVTVDTDEYASSGAWGAIVFNTSQLATDVITAVITYVNSSSTRLETIESDISALEGSMTTVQNDLNTAETDIGALQSTVSTNSTDITSLKNSRTTDEANIAVLQTGLAGGATGLKINLNPNKTEYLNTMPGYVKADLPATSGGLLTASQTAEAYPIFIESRITVKKLEIAINSGSSAGNIILGVYNNLDNAPGELIAQTASTAIVVGTTMTLNLIANAILEPGLYWLARYQSAAITLDGHNLNTTKMITLTTPTDTNICNISPAGTAVVGVRSASLGSITQLPTTFPAVGSSATKYLGRTSLGTVVAKTI